ncbi:dTDP-4-dehydrorhamnose 3,5-epimerase family protein [Micromonospora sp. NPDC050795]|uniref:dTDP-4-dehydrorhamnose 3,5-epimerase family protein n=1 Tax=Micromonospora sp. NPDC050795 TaxID=3364282 RepID=UPI00378EA0E5
MTVSPLAVTGALHFTAPVFPDDRGFFGTPLQAGLFAETTGRPLFPLAQASYSRSRRGVVRGVHYTAAPPGAEKYVYCAHGALLDIVVDIRVGSPTYGQWDAVRLTGDRMDALYLPVGVGHAFVALTDDAVMQYLLSREYEPADERAVAVLDPRLGLPVGNPAGNDLSERDRAAPTLEQAREAGLLPDYARCLAIEVRNLRDAPARAAGGR